MITNLEQQLQSATNYVWEHTNATLGFNGALWVPSGASDDIMFYAFRSKDSVNLDSTVEIILQTLVNLGFRPRLLID